MSQNRSEEAMPMTSAIINGESFPIDPPILLEVGKTYFIRIEYNEDGTVKSFTVGEGT